MPETQHTWLTEHVDAAVALDWLVRVWQQECRRHTSKQNFDDPLTFTWQAACRLLPSDQNVDESPPPSLPTTLTWHLVRQEYNATTHELEQFCVTYHTPLADVTAECARIDKKERIKAEREQRRIDAIFDEFIAEIEAEEERDKGQKKEEKQAKKETKQNPDSEDEYDKEPVDGNSGSSSKKRQPPPPSQANNARPTQFFHQTSNQQTGEVHRQARLQAEANKRNQLQVKALDTRRQLKLAHNVMYKVLLCIDPETDQLAPCIARLTITDTADVAFHGANSKVRASEVVVHWIRMIHVWRPQLANGLRFSYVRDLSAEQCSICLDAMCNTLLGCRHKLCHGCYSAIRAAGQTACPVCRHPIAMATRFRAYAVASPAAPPLRVNPFLLPDTPAKSSIAEVEKSADIAQAPGGMPIFHDDVDNNDLASAKPPPLSPPKEDMFERPPMLEAGQVECGVSFVHAGKQMVYRVGETYRIADFDNDLSNPCTRGIHGFLADTALWLTDWVHESFEKSNAQQRDHWRAMLLGKHGAAA
jgi:hypothetical protein